MPGPLADQSLQLELEGKRVLILFPHLTAPGGAMTYTLRLAAILAQRGATVAILTLRADLAHCSAPPGVEMVSLGGPLTSSLRYWALLPLWQRRMNRWIDRWRPDVIVPQVFPANWWGWLYKLSHRETRLLWICHEPSAFIHSLPWIRALRPWWKSLLARLLRPLLSVIDRALALRSDGIVANSRFTAAELQKVYGVAPVAVAYPGIDLPADYDREPVKRWEIITVARLTRFKRIDFLLEVFAELLKLHPELVFHIVGSGEDAQFLRNRAEALSLGRSVIFHGSVDDATLAALYRRSSLFLHGSVDEPFGMAPMEAIASGTPVVAHNSGGPKEFVNGTCGRLVDSLEAADWAREITEFLEYLRGDEGYRDRVQASAAGFEWSSTLEPAVRAIALICRAQSGNCD